MKKTMLIHTDTRLKRINLINWLSMRLTQLDAQIGINSIITPKHFENESYYDIIESVYQFHPELSDEMNSIAF